MNPGLHEFGVWLNRTAFSAWTRQVAASSIWVTPIVQAIHILSVCVIIGSAGVFALRLAGLAGNRQQLADMARRLLPWTWAAIGVQIVTGGLMVVNRPGRALDSLTFPYKIGMIAVSLLLLATVTITLSRDPAYWDGTAARRGTARALGALSFLLWIGVIFAGRWIYYERAPG